MIKQSLLLSILIHLITSEGLQTYDKIDCIPGLPHGSVGDFNVTRENFRTVFNAKTPTVIIVSAVTCDNCCKLEPFY